MNPLIALLQEKKKGLLDVLVSLLRKTAFDNRYSLHPRRLAGLGAELVDLVLRFVESPDQSGAFSFGQNAAREGVGDKTIVLLGSTLHGFCAEQVGIDAGVGRDCLQAIDSLCTSMLEGFMMARESQILTDQEQLRRALSTALASQGHELLIKDHAIATTINGILLADLSGKVTYVNPSFLTLWGFTSPEEAVGRSIEDFWGGEDARKIRESLPGAGGWRGEISARLRDQAGLTVELSASLIRDEKGHAIGIMSSFVDVTERKRLQSQVLQAQKMEALGQLAGGIAHDFNNLLTAISGYLQLLLIDAPRDTQMYQDLMQITTAVDRGTALTRQLRFFTRQTTGKRQVVSMNEIARETLEIIKRTFPPQISIELALSPTLDSVEADPNQLSQVLVNLCVNARDAMMDRAGGASGGTLTIETSNVDLSEADAARQVNARPGRYVALRVRDTGTGIAPEILDKLFVPFVTTKPARSGTGLGLAVVYGIVASHHGFVDVASEAGKGAVFEVFLPMSTRQMDVPVPESPAASLAQGQGTILVVDDEPQVREIITRILTGCGYTVITASDGTDALERYGTGAGIDLVILDMVMPGMGGRECLKRMREANPGARILIVTGYTSDGSSRELLGAGAAGIVEKPLHVSGFAETVRAAMGDGGPVR